MYALDLPGFGDSADVPPDIDPHEYVVQYEAADAVNRLLIEFFR